MMVKPLLLCTCICSLTSCAFEFGFDAAFGANMVLQRAPAKAAVYGFTSDCLSVKLAVVNQDTHLKQIYPHALYNVTKQPFGPDYGVRPCLKQDCPPNDMMPFNPWNRPVGSWKVLLNPTKAGGNYTIYAKCRSENMTRTVSITNVTFGDVWYCSGQSNMWLPLKHTFSRNHTVKHIQRYKNIRIMAGNSGNHPYGQDPYRHFNPGYGAAGGSNPWKTALQSIEDGTPQHPDYSLFQFGSTCWYFGQRLVELGITAPIGLINTAIGGQRIEEFMDNSTIQTCHGRQGDPWWNAQLFATQVLPFADMTIKGWVWYQGENNMFGYKGNSLYNVGYGCEMRELIKGWRKVWSTTEKTTDPLAPFGIVILASSGSEGGPNMGAMRQAQTANYGVVPNLALPNTFMAQAYDLDDTWGPAVGPCFDCKCCNYKKTKYDPTTCNATLFQKCQKACAMSDGTEDLGPIHPRSKKQVGDRLGTAAFNTVYGGKGAFTGPTLEKCSLSGDGLKIWFDSKLLRGDTLVIRKFPPRHQLPGRRRTIAGGSQLYVQTEATHFCMEPLPCTSDSAKQCCAKWAGGIGVPSNATLDDGWIMLNYTQSSASSITVDLSPLNGAIPTAVRYAWGIIDCCDYSDPDLYVTHGCIAKCPIMSSSNLPANPFQAKIVNGQCHCVAPQVCSRSPLSKHVETA